MKGFWDERYKAEVFAYGTEPNKFFEDQLKHYNGVGKILLPMEGEGRNAVFAATLGWQVTAFDFSTEGQKKALKLANENNVNIEYLVHSVEDFKAITDTFDMVALIYTHLPESLRKPFHLKLSESLKPGGLLTVEAFTPAQIGLKSGGPQDAGLLYTLELLRSDFKDLTEIFGQETTVHLTEGLYHRGEAQVVQWVAKKAT
jgi:SAM-dependent methyltransferase